VIDLDEHGDRRRLRHRTDIDIDIGRRPVQAPPIAPVHRSPNDVWRVRVRAAGRVNAQLTAKAVRWRRRSAPADRCLICRPWLQATNLREDRRDVGAFGRKEQAGVAVGRVRFFASHLPETDFPGQHLGPPACRQISRELLEVAIRNQVAGIAAVLRRRPMGRQNGQRHDNKKKSEQRARHPGRSSKQLHTASISFPLVSVKMDAEAI